MARSNRPSLPKISCLNHFKKIDTAQTGIRNKDTAVNIPRMNAIANFRFIFPSRREQSLVESTRWMLGKPWWCPTKPGARFTPELPISCSFVRNPWVSTLLVGAGVWQNVYGRGPRSMGRWRTALTVNLGPPLAILRLELPRQTFPVSLVNSANSC